MSTVAVHSLDAVVLRVPDLDAARHFYGAFGLRVQDQGDNLLLGTHHEPHNWAQVFGGHQGQGHKRLEFLRFACFEADYPALKQRCLERSGGACAPHALGDDRGCWFMHPDGFPIQLVAGEVSSPQQAALPAPPEVVVLGVGKSIARSKVKPVQPRRMSHALLFSGDVARSARFLRKRSG